MTGVLVKLLSVALSKTKGKDKGKPVIVDELWYQITQALASRLLTDVTVIPSVRRVTLAFITIYQIKAIGVRHTGI